jgi:hypothetical protein
MCSSEAGVSWREFGGKFGALGCEILSQHFIQSGFDGFESIT